MQTETISWNLQQSYTTLPDLFWKKVLPTPVEAPKLLLLNDELAQEIGLIGLEMSTSATAAILGGNQLPTGALPISQAYMGHQFGNPNMLGDGRAILLGEQVLTNGKRFDLQLKGAGQTPFSRRGDGRATLYSMLREYLISEAMYGLGIPTSRSLAVVGTGMPVYRRLPHAGAVLTRVMSSHLRVGTFEYARHVGSKEDLLAITRYALERHYPDLADAENPGLALLEAVSQKQLSLVIHWLRVGFIHGVMNTDNVSIAGETFDYGPCAFLNAYDLSTVFSSIDYQGRYAFGQQPTITHWNLAVFAGSLLPILAEDEKTATQMAGKVLDEYSQAFRPAWQQMQLAKLGLLDGATDDHTLVQELLSFLRDNRADYTNTYAALTAEKLPSEDWAQSEDFKAWFDRWRYRLDNQGNPIVGREAMRGNNPLRIPRNHLVEAALEAGIKGNLDPLREMVTELANPYTIHSTGRDYNSVPKAYDEDYETFCGT